MNNPWLRYFLGSFGLLVLQLFVLNALEISSWVYPQVYFMIILSLPVNTAHWVLMLSGFGVGMLVDWFSDTQGLHSATLTAISYLRYGYLKTVLDKDTFSSAIRPVYGAMENAWYMIYISGFSLTFHFMLFLLSDFSLAHFGDTFLKIIYSSSLSILLILLMQFVFNTRVNND